MALKAHNSGVATNGVFPDDGAELPLIGSSRLFRQVLAVVDAVAAHDCIVLLEGESGTGKELLARRIHIQSSRSNEPYIPLNCAGISETLFESQMFGHVRGAFTGAAGETLGVVRAAEGGTLLLDEVGEIPLHMQPKLLRLLQEHEVTPVGASRPIRVNTRFIASTNCNLQRMAREGTFRPDLYHRLNIVRIEVPPLRARPEDIESLIDFYLQIYARQYNHPIYQLSEGLRRQLIDYSWPGNVRELCAYIERLYVTSIVPTAPGQAEWDDAGMYARLGSRGGDPAAGGVDPAPGRIAQIDDSPITYTLAHVEQCAIRRALNYAEWNHSAAARLLAIHRSTLIRKMHSYRISRDR